ncbi:hypothetical protein BBP40_009194 [Aspergillus hancockii]|nr:hypothetical protein BBP40_009194 [Aspergillus hancockii]
MENWPDYFVPSTMQQDIICLDVTDHDERAGYSVDLQEVNFDLSGNRYNHGLRLISTIQSLNEQSWEVRPQFISAGHMAQATSSSPHHRSPVEHGVRGQALLLNQWQEPHFFTSAFPTLFPIGKGGHLDDRDVAVSLAGLAK